MKKLILIMLALVLTMSMLASCTGGLFGGGGTTEPESSDTSSETTGDTTDTSDTEPNIDNEGLSGAIEYLHQLYKDPATTGGNYDLMTQVVVGDETFTITWTVSSSELSVVPTEGKENHVTVVVPGEPTADIPYVLTATVANAAGETAVKEWNKTVPMFKYASFEEYAEAENKAPLAIIGLVSGVQSKSTGSGTNAIFVQDLNNEGGYYIYGLADDPNGVIEVGMTVDVRGEKDNYNGTLEIKNATVKIVDETIKPVTPVDYTSIILAAETLKDEALVEKQGMLVTIKGVTILEEGDNGYRYFQIGDHKTYVRRSSSNNPCSTEDLDAMDAAFKANNGKLADVTGLITLYNGAFYLMPVGADAFSNFKTPVRTDAQKVAFEIDGLKLSNRFFNAAGSLTVPVAGAAETSVAITWASNNAAVTVNGANVTVGTVTEITKVTLTATLTAGEATDTKDFVLVLMPETITVDQAISLIPELGSGDAIPGTFNFEGEVVSIDTEWSDQYKNITVTIKIGDTTIQCYRLSGTGAETIAVGDTIKVTGSISNYNGKIQLNKPTMYHEHTYENLPDKCDTCGEIKKDHVHSDVDTDSDELCDGCGEAMVIPTLTIPQVNAAADDTPVKFTGIVKSIDYAWSDSNGNMSVTVRDADNNTIYIYKLATKVALGDEITVTGVVVTYKEARQIKEGATAVIDVAHTSCSDGDDEDKLCDVCGKDLTSYTYTKETTGIEVGDVIVFAYENDGAVAAFASGFNSSNYINVIQASDFSGSWALTVVAGASEGTFAFQTADGKYLSWSSAPGGNKVFLSDTLNADSSWVVAFADGAVTVTNSATSARLLKYNSTSPRFACYTTEQTPVCIYIRTAA